MTREDKGRRTALACGGLADAGGDVEGAVVGRAGGGRGGNSELFPKRDSSVGGAWSDTSGDEDGELGRNFLLLKAN